MEQIIWNEDSIRAEMRRLDRITGLQGSTLSITFNHARGTLGSFHHEQNVPPFFTFSLYYLENPDFPPEEAIDTIRHEYAHYMDYMLNGKSGHSASWKACCGRIGARPFRLYQKSFAQYYRDIHNREQSVRQQIDSSFRAGMTLHHPVFGAGQVLRIVQQQGQSRLEIRFANGEVRWFSAVWCLEHCSTCSAPAQAGPGSTAR